MKRFLSILTALLLLCMGWVENVSAQSAVTVGKKLMESSEIVSGRPYVLKLASGNGCAYPGYLAGDGDRIYTVSDPTTLCTYRFIDQGGGTYKIQNVYTGTYWSTQNPGAFFRLNDTQGVWSFPLTAGSANPTNNGNYLWPYTQTWAGAERTTLVCAASDYSASIEVYEVGDLWVEKSSTESASLTVGQWYVMYNRGRQGYVYENTVNKLYHSPNPSGPYGGNAKFLIRLEDAGSGKYYIQTGLGHYMGVIPQNTAVPTTNNSEEKMTIGKINGTDGHFYIQGVSNNKVLDCQQDGYPVVGWNNTIPTTLNGNNDWAFYPVEFTKGGATQTNPSDIVNGGIYSL